MQAHVYTQVYVELKLPSTIFFEGSMLTVLINLGEIYRSINEETSFDIFKQSK